MTDLKEPPAAFPEALQQKNYSGYTSYSYLEAGKDYAFSRQGSDPCVDLKMQECFVKYTSWSKAKNQVALYDNYEQFYSGLANYRPRVNLICQDSPLTDPGMRQKIYRFSLAALAEENVGQFHAK